MAKSILFLIAACLIVYVAVLQFAYPVLYDPDSYYNIAVSGFIRELGLRYHFRWAQFSAFKDSFADKDLLLHLVSIPFLSLTDKPVAAAKLSAVFVAAVFIAVYGWILRRYLSRALAGAFLIFPFCSYIFSLYLLQLRSGTLANILLILGIYVLIRRKIWLVFLISLVYPLTHASFPLFFLFVLVCEGLRFLFEGSVSVKNIFAALAGLALGCVMHPNFPNNMLFLYLNGFLVPFSMARGVDPGFSGELKPLGIASVLWGNAMVFGGLVFAAWAMRRTKNRMGFASCVWFSSFCVYFALAFFSMRHWYQANALFFIFLASYISDLLKGKGGIGVLAKGRALIAAILLVCLPLVSFNIKHMVRSMRYLAGRNSCLEDTGAWMSQNIPRGGTVYHSFWDDSAYFICLAPGNNYINTNDPIYSCYGYPRELSLQGSLSMGRVADPGEALTRVFGSRYGYVRKEEPLYRQIAGDRRNFKVLHENRCGAVFKVLSN